MTADERFARFGGRMPPAAPSVLGEGTDPRPESDPVQRARRALSALYVEVHESIARDVNERVEAAFASLRAAPGAGDAPQDEPVDALLDCWRQFAYDVDGHSGWKMDGGLSTLEWACAILSSRGLIERVPEYPDMEWYREVPRLARVAASPPGAPAADAAKERT